MSSSNLSVEQQLELEQILKTQEQEKEKQETATKPTTASFDLASGANVGKNLSRPLSSDNTSVLVSSADASTSLLSSPGVPSLVTSDLESVKNIDSAPEL